MESEQIRPSDRIFTSLSVRRLIDRPSATLSNLTQAMQQDVDIAVALTESPLTLVR